MTLENNTAALSSKNIKIKTIKFANKIYYASGPHVINQYQ